MYKKSAVLAGLRGKALIAYAVVCIVWGSTYAAIRIGVDELPSFLFSGLRFFIAGLLLLGGALVMGSRLPTRGRDWRTLAVVGFFTLTGGNALVVWAEQFTPSGLASVFVTTVALWMALFDALTPGSAAKLSVRTAFGLAVGFAGSVLLVGASPAEILRADLRGPIALTVAAASWAIGSIYSKRRPTESGPYVSAAIQMIVGGIVNILIALALGERAVWPPSVRGVAALAYLVVLGSIIGYSAYAYLLRVAPPTVVGTYAYVNPVVALLLGWLFLGETITARAVGAMALILGAVVWIQLSMHRSAPPASPARIDTPHADPPDAGRRPQPARRAS
jgi:drug/metabolite transporter (DMT)-like permease